MREDKFVLLLGKRIKALRVQRKISQAQLAADCNIEISQISRIERGVINTSASQLYVIAKNLKVHPKELFDFNM